MKKFIIKSIIFPIPFLIVICTTAITDPFNYFNYSSSSSINLKKDISSRINYTLWKVISFKKKIYQNIILGDSRMNQFDENTINEVSGENYFNFSYGGGSLSEICKTFWFASENIKLKNVYIGLSFNLYTMSNTRERVSSSISLLENPILYIINRDALKATYKILVSKFIGKKVNIETPPMTEEEFWDYQLNVSPRRYYNNYTYPEPLYQELVKIQKYCRDNKINLTIIIPPTHISLQEKIKEFNLTEEYAKFLSDIKGIGTVYNFDYPNELTTNRYNFKDPYHLTKEASNLVVQEIWGKRKNHKKILLKTELF